MKKFFDPLIPRKKKIAGNVFFLNEFDKIPLPSVIEISESGTCNRTCSFCPRSAPDYKDIKEFISEDLIKKLSNELKEYDYKGIFLFSGFVEPLLDKNIYNLILIVKKNIPLARIEMVTNGDALNVDRAKKLYESGLSTLLISVYDSKEQADKIESIMRQANVPHEKYKIRHRYYSKEKDFGITLSNRSGMMENAEFSIASLKEPLKQKCYYPHYTFFMDYTGEVLVCSHDWGKKLVVGNLHNQSFKEIWLGKKFEFARKKLGNGERNFSPCNKCDVEGTLMGEEHFQSWKNKDIK